MSMQAFGDDMVAKIAQMERKAREAYLESLGPTRVALRQSPPPKLEHLLDKASYIPHRYHEVISGIITKAKNDEKVSAWLKDEAAAIMAPKHGVPPFVTLMGRTGAGKTTAALALPIILAYEWNKTQHAEMEKCIGQQEFDVAEAKRLGKWRYPKATFIHADELCDARRFTRLGEDPQIVVKAGAATLLIIDDIIGQKDEGGDLYRIIRHREEEGQPTIISTGLPQAEIEKAYGPQFARRMFSGVSKVLERKPQ